MWRILDANFNRLGEGLRVLEDIARFLLNNPSISAEIRNLRHHFSLLSLPIQSQLLSYRDIASDVGRGQVGEERKDILEVVKANARRAEEALRVLEELSPLCSLNSAPFKEGRFQLYHLEKRLISLLLRQEKRGKVKGLYVILDTQALRGRDELEVADKVIKGGAKIVQLRDKRREKGEVLPIAQRLREFCLQKDVLFIINDHLDIALACDADGLHIGQRDLPLEKARELLPIDKIIGVSVRNLEQAIKAQEGEADYIAVGSIFPTTSKEDVAIIGLETLSLIRKAVSLPLVAIGGINKDNIAEVIKLGADAVAVISAVLEAEDIEGTTRLLARRIG